MKLSNSRIPNLKGVLFLFYLNIKFKVTISKFDNVIKNVILKYQNNREKSYKLIGAQKGYKYYKLKYLKDDGIINHTLDLYLESGDELIETNTVKSAILDIKIKVTKTRNYIHN